MASTENIEKLVGRVGKLKGKNFVLKKDRFTIGSDRKCSISIKGEFIAPLHAELERRDDGVWVVTNHSVNNTLVNQKPIDVKTLIPGDTIQIGDSALFVYEVEEPKQRRRKKEKTKKTKSTSKFYNRPAFVIAVAFYLLLLIGGAILLKGYSKDREGGWSPQYVEATLQSSRNYLVNISPAEASGAITQLDDFADSAAKYYQILRIKAQGGKDAQSRAVLEKTVDELMQQASSDFSRAWHLETTGRYADAIAAYTLVLDAIPDIRAPIAGLAAYSIKKLSENFEKKR